MTATTRESISTTSRRTGAYRVTISRLTIHCRYSTTFRSAKDDDFNIQSRAFDLIAGGWGIDLVNIENSGLPLNLTYNPATQGQVSTLTSYQPNLNSGVSLYQSTGNPINYLNSGAFSLPSYTQPFGSAGRNIAHLPFFSELDFGLHKNFNLGSESRYLQFRAEAFNLLNKTNFAPSGLSLTTNSSSYGRFTSTFPARQLQLALKLYF